MDTKWCNCFACSVCGGGIERSYQITGKQLSTNSTIRNIKIWLLRCFYCFCNTGSSWKKLFQQKLVDCKSISKIIMGIIATNKKRNSRFIFKHSSFLITILRPSMDIYKHLNCNINHQSPDWLCTRGREGVQWVELGYKG